MFFPGDVLGRLFDLQERTEAQQSLPRSVKMMMGAEEEKECLIRCNWGHCISLKLWYLPYLIIVSHQWWNKFPEQTRLIVYNYSRLFLVLFLPGSMCLPTLSQENSPALKQIRFPCGQIGVVAAFTQLLSPFPNPTVFPWAMQPDRLPYMQKSSPLKSEPKAVCSHFMF